MTVNGTAFVFASRIPNVRFVPARNTTAEMESVLTCPSSHRVSHYSRHNSSKTGSVQLQIILRAGTEHLIEGGKSMLRFMRASEIAFVLVCVLGISVAWSQTATGRIIGTVTDPTGAVIPGAPVTVTNVGTQTAYSALTNEQGFYQVLLLPIGMYQVSAEMQGFQKAVTKPEKLEINQSLRIDLKMAVGARTDEIVVEEGITHVETISPTLGMSVTSLQIQ